MKAKAKHTITISFESHIDLLDHPMLHMVAEDMKVQLESLIDGTYDDEVNGTKGIDTNIWSTKVEVVSRDFTQFLSTDIRSALREAAASSIMEGCFGDGMEEDYANDGTTIVGANEMTDDELIAHYEGICGPQDELLILALTEQSVHDMLKDKG